MTFCSMFWFFWAGEPRKKSPWSMVYPQNVVFVGLHMDRKLSSTNLTSNHSSSLWTWKRAMRGPFSNWVLASMWLVVGISVSGDLKETVIPEPQFVTHWGSSKLGVIGSVVITFNQWQDDVWSHRCSRMLSKTFRTFSMCHWTTSSKFKNLDENNFAFRFRICFPVGYL